MYTPFWSAHETLVGVVKLSNQGWILVFESNPVLFLLLLPLSSSLFRVSLRTEKGEIQPYDAAYLCIHKNLDNLRWLRISALGAQVDMFG